MKKIYLLVLITLTGLAVKAQKQEPVNPAKDKRAFQGFTVQLLAIPGNYRYELWRGNKPVSKREHNPDFLMPQGFEKKEDAFKVAEWAIKEQRKTGHFPAMIPPHVAKELAIDLHPKPTKQN